MLAHAGAVIVGFPNPLALSSGMWSMRETTDMEVIFPPVACDLVNSGAVADLRRCALPLLCGYSMPRLSLTLTVPVGSRYADVVPPGCSGLCPAHIMTLQVYRCQVF